MKADREQSRTVERLDCNKGGTEAAITTDTKQAILNKIDFFDPDTRQRLADNIEASRSCLLWEFHRRVPNWTTVPHEHRREFDRGQDAAIRWVEDPNEAPALFVLHVYDYVLSNNPPEWAGDELLGIYLYAMEGRTGWGAVGAEHHTPNAAYLRGFLLGVAEWVAMAIAMRAPQKAGAS